MLASHATRVDATSWHLTQHCPVTAVLACRFALPPRSPSCWTPTATPYGVVLTPDPECCIECNSAPFQNSLIRVPQLVGADDLLTARNGESCVSSDRGAVTLGDETPLPRHRVDLVERYEVTLHPLPRRPGSARACRSRMAAGNPGRRRGPPGRVLVFPRIPDRPGQEDFRPCDGQQAAVQEDGQVRRSCQGEGNPLGMVMVIRFPSPALSSGGGTRRG